MPFESAGAIRPRRIAVIGGGVSGIGAALALAANDDVTLFEAEPRLGGHARTISAGRDEKTAVDTGFIVFNDRNYPNLTKLFGDLDVPSKPSDMSFGASFDNGRFEYALRGTAGLFGQKRNLGRPAYWRMLTEALRFNKAAPAAIGRPDLTLGQFLDDLGISEQTRQWYVLAFSGAIWSATPSEMLEFPAETFVRFFQNHGLLSMKGQPQWRTVEGGSKTYVDKAERALLAAGGAVRKGSRVTAVVPGRNGASPAVVVEGGPPEAFDAVALATHADQSLKLLQQPNDAHRGILAAVKYSNNRAVLHDDPGQMPKRRACWSSWNYLGDTNGGVEKVGVTYWMNRLQTLAPAQKFFLTLNPRQEIREEHIFDETTFAHPQFDKAAIAAQTALPKAQGLDGLFFCGAWTGYGFHEDGLRSGLAVAEALGAAPIWS